MPKAARAENSRRRCERACDNCKRKKEKCDACQPCGMCAKRQMICRFSDVPARMLSGVNQQTSEDSHRQGQEPEVSGAAVPIQTESTAPASEAPVPRAARLLSDGRGKYNYIGDSASFSFLQSARLVVSSALGECYFTSDTLQHSILEQLPKYEPNATRAPAYRKIPGKKRAERLANEYLKATGCLLDLFDATELISSVIRLSQDREVHLDLHKAVLYLVFAIGAQMSEDTTDDDEPEAYFTQGRELAYSTLNEAPSVQVVQCFSLIAMYLLGAYRTDTAFMNLGIAIRAAYTLGLHRNDIRAFPEGDAVERERAWKTIRVLDIFMSASTGRPPATSDSEKDPSYSDQFVDESKLQTSDDRFTWAVFRMCAIGERILIEVYKKRSVSTLLVDKICQQYRTWTQNLPKMPTPLENEPHLSNHITAARVISSAHLIGAYYWSIILLTRPFLLFHVSMYHQQHAYYDAFHQRGGTGLSISAIAEACIDSAIRGLDVIEDVLQHELLPRKLPVILNSILNCALTIGVAFFGDYDKIFPLTDGLRRAREAIEILERSDQQAKRYLPVVEAFTQAAFEYVQKRDEISRNQRSKSLSAMFGSVDSRFASTKGAPLTPITDASSYAQVSASSDNNWITHSDLSTITQNGNKSQTNLAETLSSDALATLTPFGLYLSRPGTRQQMRDSFAEDTDIDDEFAAWLQHAHSQHPIQDTPLLNIHSR